jgi:histidyl-tRNA synthetase
MTKGRMREFYQCDFDIAGAYDPMLPDAEILRIVCEIFQELGWEGKFSIKINHRGILDGIFAVCGVPSDKTRAISSAVDKLDKSPWEEVRKEMIEEKGLDESVADKIWSYVQKNGGPEILESLQSDPNLKDNKNMRKGLEDMSLLFRYLSAFQILPSIEFNLSLARGLDYYTGLIYEVITEGSAPSSTATGQNLQNAAKKETSQRKPPTSSNPADEDRSSDPTLGVGSVAAGGRYDELVGMFSGRAQIPCVGISFGVDRIFSITKARMASSSRLENVRINEVDVFVMAFGGKGFTGLLEERMEVARTLWEAGIKAELAYKNKPKLPAQFKAAEVGGVPFAVILGEDELREGKVKIKEMGLPEGHAEKDGVLVEKGRLVEEVRERLWRKAKEDGVASVVSITTEAEGLKIGTQEPLLKEKAPTKTDDDRV